MSLPTKIESRQRLNEAVGFAQNAFILATMLSGLATLLLAGVLPIMIGRLEAVHEQVVYEKEVFKKVADAFDEQLDRLVEPTEEKRRRLVRQADFLDKLERRSLKGRMRMAGRRAGSSMPSAQFEKPQFEPSLQIFDRQIPRHTIEMREHILSQLRALSGPTVQQKAIESGTSPSVARFHLRCPRGVPGVKGKVGINGMPGLEGPPGAQGLSWSRERRNADGCIVCPQGKQGEPGRKGQKGDQGAIGAAGIPNNRGPPGEVGSIGQPGINGAEGAHGDPGENAIRYTKGSPGAQGHRGVKGDRGDEGEIGFEGWAGIRGARGNRGVDGDRGTSGQIGSIGLQGSSGKKGESRPLCECPQRSPFADPSFKSKKGIPYYPFFRLL